MPLFDHGIRVLLPLAAVAVVLSTLPLFAAEPDELGKSRAAFHSALLEVDINLQNEQKALRSNYLDALTRLENERRAAGDSAGVTAVQNEKERIAAGDPLADQSESHPAEAIRAVYLKSLRDIQNRRLKERSAKRQIYRGLLENLATTLKEAGRVADLPAVEREIETLAALVDASELPVSDRSGNRNGADSVERLIPLPEEWPPIQDEPFSKTSWPESMTVPAGSYRLRDAIGIGGHRKGTLIRFSKGSEFSHAKGKFHVWGGRLVAEDCRFSGVPFRADHTGSVYFVACRFKDCTIREEGNWWGSGNYDSKWSFENCVIEGSLHSGMFNVNYLGLCMTRCSLSRVELPGVWYRDGEPASLRNNKWLTVKNCRFEKCKVPLSFLSITTDCAFIDCRFEDDEAEQKFSKPFEVTFYSQDSINTIRKAPEIITLTERPISELKAPCGAMLADE